MKEDQLIGRRIIYFDEIDSTNAHALSLAHDPGQEGLVVLAGEQNAGRGQHGRTWTAPAGSSVLMSVLLFPPPELRRPTVLTAWAAVAVCRLVQQAVNQQARIKWPNDVLVQGKKVCGILIEQRSMGSDRLATVVGIGLNVSQSADWFTAAGLTSAASLAVFSAGEWSNSSCLADQLICTLDEEYRSLLAGELPALEACWKWHLGLLGKQVVVECAGQSFRGRIRDVTFAGLELETTAEVSNATLRLQPESVRHIVLDQR